MAANFSLFVLSGVFFFVLFSPWTKAFGAFWVLMPTLTALLAMIALATEKRFLRRTFKFSLLDAIMGVFSGFLLYLTFLIGKRIIVEILPGSTNNLSDIYALATRQSKLVIGLLLVFIIAPAEEIFWRFFLQRRLSKQFDSISGLVVATAGYVLVHIWSFNPVLLLASLVCGAYWGFLYYKTRSIWLVIISHALFDLLIFVLLPLG